MIVSTSPANLKSYPDSVSALLLALLGPFNLRPPIYQLPISAQIAQGSKWGILKQMRLVIRQTGGFRGRRVHFWGSFGCRMKFGIRSSGYIMGKIWGFWVTLKSSHLGVVKVNLLLF